MKFLDKIAIVILVLTGITIVVVMIAMVIEKPIRLLGILSIAALIYLLIRKV